MKLRLIHTEVLNLTLQKLLLTEEEIADSESKKENTYNLNLNVFPDVSRLKVFGVLFSLRIINQDGLSITTEYVAWFETEADISEESINSPFARINAPAMAFPFLRAFISLLSLNAGFKPVIIPTLNFVELYEKSKIENSEKKES